MGLYSDEADWVAGQLFANVSMYIVAFLTLNTDTDTDTEDRSVLSVFARECKYVLVVRIPPVTLG